MKWDQLLEKSQVKKSTHTCKLRSSSLISESVRWPAIRGWERHLRGDFPPRLKLTAHSIGVHLLTTQSFQLCQLVFAFGGKVKRGSTHSQACLNLDFYEDMFERLERIYLSFPIVHSGISATPGVHHCDSTWCQSTKVGCGGGSQSFPRESGQWMPACGWMKTIGRHHDTRCSNRNQKVQAKTCHLKSQGAEGSSQNLVTGHLSFRLLGSLGNLTRGSTCWAGLILWASSAPTLSIL